MDQVKSLVCPQLFTFVPLEAEPAGDAQVFFPDAQHVRKRVLGFTLFLTVKSGVCFPVGPVNVDWHSKRTCGSNALSPKVLKKNEMNSFFFLFFLTRGYVMKTA